MSKRPSRTSAGISDALAAARAAVDAEPKAEESGSRKGGVHEGKTAGGLKRLSIYLPDRMLGALDAEATRRGLSKSALVKLALSDWLDQNA